MSQMRLGKDFLPELDRKATQRAVEEALEKYHICRYLTFEEREASTTASYSDMPRSYTGTTSDQTGQIGTSNVDTQRARKAYCEQVERAVAKLPRMERFLIEERYMSSEAPYLSDQTIYNHKFSPPISQPVYAKHRWKAFYKLALHLRIEVVKEQEEQ